MNNEHPSGMFCFGNIMPCSSSATFSTTSNYCDTSWDDATALCSTTCRGGIDDEYPPGPVCFGGVILCNSSDDNGE